MQVAGPFWQRPLQSGLILMGFSTLVTLLVSSDAQRALKTAACSFELLESCPKPDNGGPPGPVVTPTTRTDTLAATGSGLLISIAAATSAEQRPASDLTTGLQQALADLAPSAPGYRITGHIENYVVGAARRSSFQLTWTIEKGSASARCAEKSAISYPSDQPLAPAQRIIADVRAAVVQSVRFNDVRCV